MKEKIHILKCDIPFFEDVKNGIKTGELRFNDRDFKVGDVLRLREYNSQSKSYSGIEQFALITHILKEYKGLDDGYCMISFKLMDVLEAYQYCRFNIEKGFSSGNEWEDYIVYHNSRIINSILKIKGEEFVDNIFDFFKKGVSWTGNITMCNLMTICDNPLGKLYSKDNPNIWIRIDGRFHGRISFYIPRKNKKDKYLVIHYSV